MICAVIPTRDRPDELARTLSELDRLSPDDLAEVIVIDNASRTRPSLPARLSGGQRVELVCLDENIGAAARNIGAELSSSDWVLMLDDDSHPSAGGMGEVLAHQDPGVAAVTMDIHLSARGVRESGGLPEVPVGCGVAYRRRAFLDAGGYDAAFGYYAEEYDLAGKLLLAGHRVAFERGLRVEHRKVAGGRDMGLILGRLVRNNGWVLQRYAPRDELEARMREMIDRYGTIARKENVVEGFRRGHDELLETLDRQRVTALEPALWDRFTGLSAAREALGAAQARHGFASARLIARGKHDWAVERALVELGVAVRESGEVDVIGTLSPGPMIDAMERGSDRQVVAPWVDAVGALRPEQRCA